MKISTKGRYALRLMVDLALDDNDGYISLRTVAERQGISVKYMEQIVGPLHKAGLLSSIRGPQGGYRLARRPTAYTVGDILRITEGSIAPVACLDDDPNCCPRANNCSTLAFWESLYAHMLDYLDNTSLATIVEQELQRQKAVPIK